MESLCSGTVQPMTYRHCSRSQKHIVSAKAVKWNLDEPLVCGFYWLGQKIFLYNARQWNKESDSSSNYINCFWQLAGHLETLWDMISTRWNYTWLIGNCLQILAKLLARSILGIMINCDLLWYTTISVYLLMTQLKQIWSSYITVNS